MNEGENNKKYLIPNYLDKFNCKCGECRNTCCVGWTVTMSLNEYFKLMNLECDQDFREKLDRGIYVCINPTAERYAYIKKNYYGDCVFHAEDGLCEIHKRFGENCISDVCRMYPKCFKNGPFYEKSCGNSCEGVLEILFDMEKIEFTSVNDDSKIVIDCVSIIQENELLKDKFIKIAKYLDYNVSDEETISLNDVIRILYDYLLLYQNNNHSISDYIDDIIKNVDLSLYEEHKEHLYSIVPNYNDFISKVIGNHMIFTDFPFEKVGHNKLSFYSLCGVYAFTTFITTIEMRNKNTITDLIDILSKIFRLVEHSKFDINIGKYLKSKLQESDLISLIRL